MFREEYLEYQRSFFHRSGPHARWSDLQQYVAGEILLQNNPISHSIDFIMETESPTTNLHEIVQKFVDAQSDSIRCTTFGDLEKTSDWLFVSDTWVLSLRSRNPTPRNYPAYSDEEESRYSKITLQCNLLYTGENPQENIINQFKELGLQVIQSIHKKDTIPIVFSLMRDDNSKFYERSFESVPFHSIEQNYTPAVVEKTTSLVSKLKSGSYTSGLVLIDGPVGTGKTYLIRSILSELRAHQGIVCSPPLLYLNGLSYLVEVAADYAKPLIVLEDIGDVLAIDAVSHHINVTSNLLNVSDGLLALLSDMIVLCSFNYTEKLNPAIIRSGRCIERIQVGNFDQARAEEWIGHDLPKERDGYSLADLYRLKEIT